MSGVDARIGLLLRGSERRVRAHVSRLALELVMCVRTHMLCRPAVLIAVQMLRLSAESYALLRAHGTGCSSTVRQFGKAILEYVILPGALRLLCNTQEQRAARLLGAWACI